jgi:hypothetical protein
MPDANTFNIKPIHSFIMRHMVKGISIDPFANTNNIASITNDLDPDMGTDYNLDALDFLKLWDDSSIACVLFDPPYSSRQVSEVYKKFDMTVNMETTQGSFWSKLKDEIYRIVEPNGVVLCFGWNSNGIGKKRGFDMKEVMIVAHGGAHYDTICTAEYKIPTLFDND